MEKRAPDEPPRPSEGRLDSWKKIAVYLKRDVTTVQRWEKREGMPVHRQLHDKMGSVYAFRSELDDWMQRRSEPNPLGAAEPTPSETPAVTPPSRLANSPARSTLLAVAGALAAVAVVALLWLQRGDRFWRNPIAGAAYQPVTGFDGRNEAAAVSRDGQFVAFLSDRGGRTDVWVTQFGSGQFHNLTKDVDGELINPSIRTLGFSPDGALVTFWLRNRSGPPGEDISIWAVPTLGGQPRPYLEGVAEAAWSPDGKRLAYHTPGAGDPGCRGNAAVGRRRRSHHRRPRDLRRRTPRCFLREAARADAAVHHGIRWLPVAHRIRLAAAARRAGLGA
jgi:hypothetical protein